MDSIAGPVPNLPLLRKVLDHIDAHPEQWEQGKWGAQSANEDKWCGTPMCVAGWAAFLSGEQAGRDVWGSAESALGLTREEAGDLFIGTIGETPVDERRNVQRVAETIAARAGERL